MATKEEFERAQADVKTLKKVPSNDDLLKLYGLFKQATVGDVAGKRPGMLDPKGRAKYDAWEGQRGTDAEPVGPTITPSAMPTWRRSARVRVEGRAGTGLTGLNPSSSPKVPWVETPRSIALSGALP
ncbi:MAG: acyl-CoA-binding protein [Polyangiaceae bacterium]